MTYDQWRTLLVDVRLPAALVDLDAFDRNVRHLADLVRRRGLGQRLRLATKSLRVPALIERVLRAVQPYAGLMCYAAEEAAFLASRGFDDLLVAYPTVQPSDLQALRELHESGKDVKLVVDSLDGLRVLSNAMRGLETPFHAVLEVDMSLRALAGRVHLGVRRSPVRTAGDVLRIFEDTNDLRGVRLVGLMAYEAQVAGLTDRNPFRRLLNPAARLVRRVSVHRIARRRAQIAQALADHGFRIDVFNGGGTGSVSFAVSEPWLTELAAGSAFLCPHLFDYYSNLRLEPACFFALQVVRSSDGGYATCHGGGYIASGEPGWDKVPCPYLPERLRLVGAEGCGEVQTPLRVPSDCRLSPGSPVLFRHAKAGELAEHFAEYLLVSGGKIVERAATYRGLGQCFL